MAFPLVVEGLHTRPRTERRPALGWAGEKAQAILDFYGDRRARRLLAVTSILLTYGGGAAMFWFHAVYRGEKGPAISNVSHWFLDSTLGFVALTPVVLILLPAACRLVRSGSEPRHLRVLFWALLMGVSFALVTAPGPALHNLIAGEGRPLADWATDVFGQSASVASRAHGAHSHSNSAEGILQVIVGLPVYIFVSWSAFHLSAARGLLDPSGRRG
jgi:hypothetical protein